MMNCLAPPSDVHLPATLSPCRPTVGQKGEWAWTDQELCMCLLASHPVMNSQKQMASEAEKALEVHTV